MAVITVLGVVYLMIDSILLIFSGHSGMGSFGSLKSPVTAKKNGVKTKIKKGQTSVQMGDMKYSRYVGGKMFTKTPKAPAVPKHRTKKEKEPPAAKADTQ